MRIMSRRQRGNSSLGISDQLKTFGGLTFFKDYRAVPNPTVTADYSVGSPVATFTYSVTASARTYVDGSGVIMDANVVNTPRFQGGYYDATGFHAQKGLMIERASTNLAQDSYFLDGTNTYWHLASDPTVTAKSTDYVNPYGGGTVIKIVTPSNVHGIYSNAATITDATKYTVSALVRGTGTIVLYFDKAATTTSSSFTLSPTEWRLFQHTFTSNSALAAAVGVLSGAAADLTCYVAAIQMEALPYATSFIPTTTAAVTRNAESLSYVSASNRTEAQESIFIKFAAISVFANDTKTRTLLYDPEASAGTRLIYKGDNATKPTFYPNSESGDAGVTASTTVPAANTSYVVAMTANSANVNPNNTVYVNGASEGSSNTNWTSKAFATSFQIGHTATSDQLDGIIQSIAIFSDVKDQAAVTAITQAMQ